MQLKTLAVAALFSAVSMGASAFQVNVYNGAGFSPAGPDSYQLFGFGRGSSSDLGIGAADAAPLEPFFDTWNLSTTGIAPGEYSFAAMVVNAAGGLTFNSVSLSSYDALGQRHTVLFDLNAGGTQATGTGQFTVLESCPVSSCVWIDVTGMQPAGSLAAGYGGTTLISQVPEPAAAALWALGLLGLGLGAAWRRRPAHAGAAAAEAAVH